MFFFKSQHFLLLPTLFLDFSTLPVTYGASQCHQTSTALVRDMRDGGDYIAASWGEQRYLLEDKISKTTKNTSLILAAKRTHRRDPLDHFRYYEGGWNITNHHYFVSAGFTGAPLFLIAAIWFLGLGLCLFIIGLYYCCCHQQRYGYYRNTSTLSLIFLTFFTVAAITGCFALFIGQQKFHRSTIGTLQSVSSKVDIVVRNLRNVSNHLAAAKEVQVFQFLLPPDVQESISKVQRMINSSSHTLKKETNKHSKDIRKVLNYGKMGLITVAAVMLFLALLGFLFSVLGLQFLVYTLVILGWILVTLTLVLCGVFLIFNNVTADTCVAMDQWLENPRANSAMDHFLPCLDNATAQETLSETKDVTSQLVGNVNKFIKIVPNSPKSELNYNQSGPLVPLLCNHYLPNMRECAKGEVNLTNAAQEWRKYVCKVSESGNCISVGRLTPDFYKQMVAVVDACSALYHYGPFLVNLVNCAFLREAIKDISGSYCPGLRQNSKRIYVGLGVVSVAILFSLLLWLLRARQRRSHSYKQFRASTPPSYSTGYKAFV